MAADYRRTKIRTESVIQGVYTNASVVWPRKPSGGATSFTIINQMPIGYLLQISPMPQHA
jgi:hypothetical protein